MPFISSSKKVIEMRLFITNTGSYFLPKVFKPVIYSLKHTSRQCNAVGSKQVILNTGDFYSINCTLVIVEKLQLSTKNEVQFHVRARAWISLTMILGGSSATESSPFFPLIPTHLYVTGIFGHLHWQLVKELCSHHVSASFSVQRCTTAFQQPPFAKTPLLPQPSPHAAVDSWYNWWSYIQSDVDSFSESFQPLVNLSSPAHSHPASSCPEPPIVLLEGV